MIKIEEISDAAASDLFPAPVDLKMNPNLLEDPFPENEVAPVTWPIPKTRSDLAFASGFVALACVFSRFSLLSLIFELKHGEHISDSVFFIALPLVGLPAPLALCLGIAAWVELKYHPNLSGKVPAVIGLVIGLAGTLVLLFEAYEVIRFVPFRY